MALRYSYQTFMLSAMHFRIAAWGRSFGSAAIMRFTRLNINTALRWNVQSQRHNRAVSFVLDASEEVCSLGG